MPEVVDTSAFRAASAEFLKEEIELTHLQDALTEKRRALPATEVKDPSRFLFTAADGSKISIVEMFAGYKQLILYHFMLYDKSVEGCVACSFNMDHIPTLSHMQLRNTTFAAIAPAHIDKINAFRERLGWKFPFYSSKDTFTAAKDAGEDVTWSDDIVVLLKDGDKVLHTYITQERGAEPLMTTYHMLDWTHMGRQDEGNGILNFKFNDKY